MKTRGTSGRRGRRGVALIIVIGMVGMIMLIAGIMAMSSQVARVNAASNAARSETRYTAESGLAVTTWTILSRRQADATVRVTGEAAVSDLDLATQGWSATNGELAYSDASGLAFHYTVRDAATGLELGGLTDLVALRRMLTDAEGATATPDVDRLIDSLADYIDGDDLKRLHGLERGDYESLDASLGSLPRNGAPMLKEEWYWLPTFPLLLENLGYDKDAPPSSVILRPVSPTGQRIGALPSLMSASPELLASLAGLDEHQVAQVVQARRAWREEQIPLSQGLGDLYAVVMRHFSLVETGVYTIAVSASVNGRFERRLEATIDLRNVEYSDERPYLSYWERCIE